MILQTDPGFYSIANNHIRYPKWGCYMMVLFWFIVMKTKYSLNTHRIENLTKIFETYNLIKSDLYVNAPYGILARFGINTVTRREGIYYICKRNEFETLIYQAINTRTN